MYTPHWSLLIEPVYLRILLHGVALTLSIAALSSLLSIALGVALAIGRTRSQSTQAVVCARLCAGFCHVVRSIPGVFWLILPFYCLPFLLPQSACRALNGWEHFPFWAAVAGLTVNNAPYLADILFSVMHTTGRDALACARLSGFTGWRYWFRLVLPLACSASLPALNARMVHNLKNSSLAMFISVPELTWASQEVESLSFAGLESTTAATVLYMGLGLGLSGLLLLAQRHMERRQRGEARA